MDELEKLVNEKTTELALIQDIIKRFGKNKVGEMLMIKNAEDGIINALCNAKDYQLDRLKGAGCFTYYDKPYVTKKIDAEIKRRNRERKLKRIL